MNEEKPVTKKDLILALENLAVRFPMEHGTIYKSPFDVNCECLQFEDHGDCRHVHAIKILKQVGSKIVFPR